MQHSCSHYNSFCSMTWLTCIFLRTWQHQMTTIMQPFQHDLQPQSQETHRTTHTGTTTRCRAQRRNRLTSKRSKPHPPHTGGTFHRRLQSLYTEKYKVSCSGFLPKTKPMQHSCSHCNAFCSMTWLTCISRRTWQHQMTTIMQPFQCDLQPQIQETHRTTHTGTTTLHQGQFFSDVLLCSVKPHTTLHQGQFFSDVLLCSVKSHTTLHQGQFFSDTTLHQGQFFSDVLLCSVTLHATLHQGQFFSDVLLCSVKSHTTLHQGQFFSDVLLCSVKSHTTLHQGQFFSDVLLCNVKSHTTLHQGQFFSDVLLCNVKSRTTLLHGQFFSDVLLCSVKSHTTLHQGQFFSDVLLCSVKSHTTLHQVKVIRNSEVLLPNFL